MELLVEEAITEYSDRHTSEVNPLLRELLAETEARTGKLDWSIGKVQGQFLRMLVGLSQAKFIVELGTLTGFSALIMAEALPPDGRVLTCDSDAVHAEIARSFFARSPHGKKIQLEFGDAMKSLSRIQSGTVDGVFVDADKEQYPGYYEESLRVLKVGGWIAIDNVLWDGEVVDPENNDPDVTAIKRFNDKVREDNRVDKVMLTIRDGIYLVRKR
ncbi:MAG: methyltransferase [Acidobacteria bacterium]|nr:MAG: methyltransferase [Acidobacteriota bacterium]